jgi:hypothetical protein
MFYKVPDRIFSPVKEKKILNGNILIVNDQSNQLSVQVQDEDCNIINAALNDIVESSFWENSPEIDWVLCVTQGLGRKSEWVIDVGCSMATKGLCLLDRLSFLEPTRGREALLKSKSLTNLIVLSPRPSFRADSKQLKDSMTSAWFIFDTNSNLFSYTNIEFAIHWDRPKVINRGQQVRGSFTETSGDSGPAKCEAG